MPQPSAPSRAPALRFFTVPAPQAGHTRNRERTCRHRHRRPPLRPGRGRPGRGGRRRQRLASRPDRPGRAAARQWPGHGRAGPGAPGRGGAGPAPAGHGRCGNTSGGGHAAARHRPGRRAGPAGHRRGLAAALQRTAGAVLGQPLHRQPGQGQHPRRRGRVRARGHPPAHRRPLRRPAARRGAARRDAALPGQRPFGRARFGRGAPPGPPCRHGTATADRPEREPCTRAAGTAHPGRSRRRCSLWRLGRLQPGRRDRTGRGADRLARATAGRAGRARRRQCLVRPRLAPARAQAGAGPHAPRGAGGPGIGAAAAGCAPQHRPLHRHQAGTPPGGR